MKKKINLIFLFSIMMLMTNKVLAYKCNNGQEYVGCGSGTNATTGIPAFVPNLTSLIITLMKIIIPIILIITGTIELFKSIISGNPDNIPKGKKKITNKFIGALLAFFVITFTTNVVKLIAKRNERSSLASCLSCYLNNNCTDDESVCRDTNDKVVDDEDVNGRGSGTKTIYTSEQCHKVTNAVTNELKSQSACSDPVCNDPTYKAAIDNTIADFIDEVQLIDSMCDTKPTEGIGKIITELRNLPNEGVFGNVFGNYRSRITNIIAETLSPNIDKQEEQKRNSSGETTTTQSGNQTTTTTQSGNQTTTDTQENSSSVNCSTISNPYAKEQCEKGKRGTSTTTQSGNQATTNTQENSSGVDCSSIRYESARHMCEEAKKNNSSAVQSIPNYKGEDCSTITDKIENVACEIANNSAAQEYLNYKNEIKQKVNDTLPSSLKN